MNLSDKEIRTLLRGIGVWKSSKLIARDDRYLSTSYWHALSLLLNDFDNNITKISQFIENQSSHLEMTIEERDSRVLIIYPAPFQNVTIHGACIIILSKDEFKELAQYCNRIPRYIIDPTMTIE